MSETKQYPEWQKSFRDMQVIRDETYAKTQEKAREEKAESDREKGRDLAKALMHFGIYLETAPETNSVEIGGYTFQLAQGQYRTYAREGEKEWFDFTFVVRKAIPGRTSEDDDPTHYRHITVNTLHISKTVTHAWDYYLCQLADAFDELDAAVNFDVARDAERKQREEARRLNPPEHLETAEEKFFAALRSLVADEVMKQLEY